MEEQQQSFRFQMTKMHVKTLVPSQKVYQNSYDDTDALEAALKSSPNIAF
jgi:hypothetical protein